MNLYFKIFLIIFAVLYLLSPLDIIPDLLLPFVGWIDDGVVIGVIYYLIRYGRLPNFLFKKQGFFKQSRVVLTLKSTPYIRITQNIIKTEHFN